MSVDLAEYSKPIRDALKRGQFCCVYIAMIEAASPLCRVGYAEDLSAAVARLNRMSLSVISVASALWVPDKGIAMVIAKAVQCDLAPHQKAGGWFELSAAQATSALEIAAFRIYPGANVAWHEQLMEQWARRG